MAPISMPIQLSEGQCHPSRKGIIQGQEPAYEKRAWTLGDSGDSPWAVLKS